MNATHNLKNNGAPYTDAATLVNQDPKATAGEGRALCTCGQLSDVLSSGRARREWHKAHKLEALDAEVTAEKAETEAIMGQDVLADTPEDEVAAALAELVEDPKPAKAKKAPKAKDVTAADEPNAYTQRLPFGTEFAPGFWRSLGRDAAQHVVDALHPTVNVTPDNNALALVFQGPEEDVPAAVATVQALWQEALAATKDWKLTDPKFLGRSEDKLARRREGYHLTEEFYRSFGHEFATKRSRAGK